MWALPISALSINTTAYDDMVPLPPDQKLTLAPALTGNHKRLSDLFARKYDTKMISWQLGWPEARVYNILAEARNLLRERRGKAL